MPASDSQLPIERAYLGKSVVITGASGYLASAFVKRLSQIDCTIVRVTRSADLPRTAGKAKVIDRKASLADPGSAADVVSRADVVFHLSAQTSVKVAEEDPSADALQNVEPAAQLLEAARKCANRPALVFASTATVVGPSAPPPVNESAPVCPVTVYDSHKAQVEAHVAAYARDFDVRAVAVRIPNVYGPGPASKQADRGILNQMVARGLRGEPLTIFGAGNQLRDYLFIDDVVSAFLLAGEHVDALKGKAVVIGSGKGRTFAEAVGVVADRLQAVTGTKVQITHAESVEVSPIEGRNYVADAGFFSGVTGWTPTVEFEAGIDRTINSFSKGIT